MDHVAIQDWHDYLSATAGAAATLTGLVFVAVSINLAQILTLPGLTSLAAESLVQLLGATFISMAMLIPWQPPPALGIGIFSLNLVLWLIQSRLQAAYLKRKTGHPLRWAATRIVRTQCACVPFGIAGLLLWRGSPAGMYWLAAGFLFSFIAGVANAWVLLVEILR